MGTTRRPKVSYGCIVLSLLDVHIAQEYPYSVDLYNYFLY